MCKFFEVQRSFTINLIFKRKNNRIFNKEEIKLENVVRICKESGNNYGNRKINKQL